MRKQLADAAKLPPPEKMKKFQEEACGLVKGAEDVLSGRVQPNDPAGFAGSSQERKDFLRKVADAMQKLCVAPTSENSVAVTRLLIEEDRKTCSVFSWAGKQSFSKDVQGNWAAIPERTGLCGVILLDKFEPERDAVVKMTMWNFIARKVVTNKKSELCAGLDEKEYRYSWRSRPIEMNCQHIKFGF